jgi:hypothetical protein
MQEVFNLFKFWSYNNLEVVFFISFARVISFDFRP